MVRRRRLVVLPALLVVLLLVACSTDPYTASMKASLDVSNAISDGVKVIGTLQQDKLVSTPEAIDLLGYLNTLTTLNQKFRQDVRVIHNSGAKGKVAYIEAASTFAASANDPQLLTALHVVNPKAQAMVQAIVAAIQTTLTAIQTAINAAKGA